MLFKKKKKHQREAQRNKQRAQRLSPNLWKAPKAFLWYSSCVLRNDAATTNRHGQRHLQIVQDPVTTFRLTEQTSAHVIHFLQSAPTERVTKGTGRNAAQLKDHEQTRPRVGRQTMISTHQDHHCMRTEFIYLFYLYTRRECAVPQ